MSKCKHDHDGLCVSCSLHHLCPFDDDEKSTCHSFEEVVTPPECANIICADYCSKYGAHCTLTPEERLDCEDFEEALS